MKPTSEEIRNVLDAVLPSYRKISEAPRDSNDIDTRYKCADQFGNIYTTTNPYAWRERFTNGMRFFLRPAPKKEMSWGEAKRAAGVTAKEELRF